MPSADNLSSRFPDTKPHYEVLDALRGVAAIIVIWYHVFEGYGNKILNHGNLAVDFFFMLSGFVVSYAYDNRWDKMTVGSFFKRRLIRLHPMVIAGTVLGTVAFLLQGSVMWSGEAVGFGWVMLAMLLSMLMIPALPNTGFDIRGNGEMFPINGPTWSLFFEYVGNFLYALVIRRLSTKALRILVVILGTCLIGFSSLPLFEQGFIGGGWSLEGWQFPVGFTRMMFAFTAGMLISRTYKQRRVKSAFWICTLILIAFLNVPHLGGDGFSWINGLYDSFCVIAVFPVVVWLGACGDSHEGYSCGRFYRFLGDISYPVYTIHYPLMYLFFAWIWENDLPFSAVWPVAIAIFIGSLCLAYLFLKFYDIPIRKRLTRK